MNVYEKLQKCRVELQGKKLKKSGKNAFAKYSYYELADFLPPINKLFQEVGLCSNFSIIGEYAQLEIVNVEKPEEKILFTSPIAEANVKGCSPVQNLGGIHTYLKRYLYQNALEIVESDIIDGNTEKEPDYRAMLSALCKDKKLNAMEVCNKYNLSKESKNEDYKRAYNELA